MSNYYDRIGVLAVAAGGGDASALDELVASMGAEADKVASSFAHKVVGGEAYRDDYKNEAMIGLIQCLKTFQSDRGLFYPYAANAMRMAVRSFISNNQRIVRQPKHVIEKISKLNKALCSYEYEGVQSPDYAALSSASGLTEAQVRKTLLAKECQSIYSLDYLYGEDGEDVESSLLSSCVSGESVESSVISSYMSQRMREAILSLNDRDRDVLCTETGAFGYEKLSVGVIAKKYGVTTATIRNWRSKIKNRLRCAIC